MASPNAEKLRLLAKPYVAATRAQKVSISKELGCNPAADRAPCTFRIWGTLTAKDPHTMPRPRHCEISAFTAGTGGKAPLSRHLMHVVARSTSVAFPMAAFRPRFKKYVGNKNTYERRGDRPGGGPWAGEGRAGASQACNTHGVDRPTPTRGRTSRCVPRGNVRDRELSTRRRQRGRARPGGAVLAGRAGDHTKDSRVCDDARGAGDLRVLGEGRVSVPAG
mmetsp:Transcript_9357/g.25299  ORF Transcript_9357/g.25299 Transcript_9357/m.25299 type:complete len:221 (-) Transcript_9357:2871-3533(-)